MTTSGVVRSRPRGLTQSLKTLCQSRHSKLVSYKDICVGINGNDLGDEDDEEDYINNSGSDAEEEDDELEEGDEEMVPQDPLCPVIKVSKQELKEACKPWKKAIIVKLLGK